LALPERIHELGTAQGEAAIALIESTARPRGIPICCYDCDGTAGSAASAGAPRRSGGRQPERLADGGYRVRGHDTVLLAELERLTNALSRTVANAERAAAAPLLKQIDALLRGLRAEMVIPVASSLGRQLDSIGSEAAALGRAALRYLRRMAKNA
jgi:hypothetical protein